MKTNKKRGKKITKRISRILRKPSDKKKGKRIARRVLKVIK